MDIFKKEFWDKNNDIFNHLFIGTNDYNKDIKYLQDILSEKINNKKIKHIDKVLSVSGGWFYILSSIPNSYYIKEIILYDVNPNMLYIYNLIYILLITSNNRNEFIENLFCRKIINEFKNNDQIIKYMNQDVDKNIYINTKNKFKKMINGKCALIIYKILFKKYISNISNDHKYTNVIPSYHYEKDNYLIFNKKLHTTQNIKNSYHYLTTFYYNILDPFKDNDKYQIIKNHLLVSNVNFKILDLNNINEKTLDYKEKDVCVIYIDGIDLEYSKYLIIKRDELFKNMQNIVINKKLDGVYILSTKSGFTSIYNTSIITDDEYNKDPENFKNLPKLKMELDYSIDKKYIKLLNDNKKMNLIYNYKYIEKDLYNIFKQMPKICNKHIHFSTIISYKKILNIIDQNNIKDIYINDDEDNLLIGFKNDEINEKNGELYNKEKHYEIIKKYIETCLNDNNFRCLNKLGSLFYNILKYEKFIKEYYLDEIVKYMKNHNVKYMNVRILLGTMYKIVNGKKVFLDINDELEILYKYRKYFNIIICISKCDKNLINKLIKTIEKIDNKYKEIILGYDFVGDEDKCNSLDDIKDKLKEVQNRYNIKYYIHAGEFINSESSYKNLLSLCNLKVERIGHASFYLLDNKYKLKYNKKCNKNDIYEICPLSNYLLHNYIYDNNKLNKIINNIVIGSDDDNKLNSNISLDYMFLYKYYNIDIKQIKEIIKKDNIVTEEFEKEFDEWFNKNLKKLHNFLQ